MSREPRRTNPSDPTAERTAEQSTQSASGLSGGRAAGRDQDGEDLLNRDSEERYDTPRRYEESDGPPEDGGKTT